MRKPEVYSGLLIWAVREKVRKGWSPVVLAEQYGISRRTIEDWASMRRRRQRPGDDVAGGAR